jgi:benzoyl-CoA reductase/2-hydroxyglutaryl-CoA dehydratase subunit BcrC/BadD/HgdB
MDMQGFLDTVRDLKEQGRRVAGCFPLYPPLELLHSFGLTPVMLWGLNDDLQGFSRSDRHLQPYACQVARALVEFVLEHGPGLFDALLMYNACDTLRNLPEIIASGLDGSSSRLPVLRLHVPALPLDQAGAAGYLRGRVRSLAAELEDLTGRPFSGESFARSIDLYRRQRALCMEVEGLLSAGSLPLAPGMGLLMGSNRIPVEDHIPLLEAFVNEGRQAPAHGAGRPGVLISGILPPPEPLLDAIDKAGLRVAANDIAALKRFYSFTPETTPDPERYYEDFYRGHHPCTTILPSADGRLQFLREVVQETGVGGVIFFGEKFCEYEYFEFPYLEGMLKELGVRSLLLEMSAEGLQNLDGYRTRIEAFAETLA